VTAALCLLTWLAGCSSGPASRTEVPPAWLAWHATRHESIGGTNGWATLAGLHWLREGTNNAGTEPHGDIIFPAGRGPVRAGVFVRTGKSVQFIAAPDVAAQEDGQPVTQAALQSDEAGKPSVLELGGLRMFVIVRGERVGLRVKDPLAPTRLSFHGLDYFPYDARFRVEARFESYQPPKRIPFADVTGVTTDEPCPGALVFKLDGRELRLDALEDKEAGDLFLIFRDATSGTSTYGSGRYLHAPMPDAQGRVVLDFNFAYNPPCAFTDFATCQLPPRQNWLPIMLEVGEKRYRDGH
jgi:uncharacterized protein (DUF1684 family)